MGKKYFINRIFKSCIPNCYSLQKIQENASNINHLSLDKSINNNHGLMSMYYCPPNNLKNVVKKINLNEGDVLFLPKGWWHYVVSEPNSLSINMWSNNLNLKDYPVIRKKFIDTKVDNFKIPENVHIWCNKENCNGIDNARNMILSLVKYTKCNKKSNKFINIFKKYKLYEKEASVNYWYAIDNHATPLHYDNSDNIIIVLKGKKTFNLIHPKYSDLLLPTIIDSSIEPYIKKNMEANILFDSGKRAYGNEYWECKNLSKNCIASCAMLFCFMKHYNFPKQCYQHIQILQYAFGTQSIVYGCKLSIDKKPYIEIYFFKNISNRNKPYNISEEYSIDLTKTIKILEDIEYEYFKINREKNKISIIDAIYVSFEIYPEIYKTKKGLPFDVYIPQKSKSNVLCTINYYQLNNNVKNGMIFKGTFSSLSTKKYKFYWEINKLTSKGKFYVGMDKKEFLNKLKNYNFKLDLIKDISQLYNLNKCALEFCETFNKDSKRGGFYGIV